MGKKVKMQPKVYINNFILYGLNRHRNFLQASICEECNCGNKMHMLFDKERDLCEFMAAMLYDHDCPESAIFAVGQDNNFLAAIKLYDDETDEFTVQVCKSNDMHMFAELDGEMRFCCYGLIIEYKPGEWMIQE